MTDFVPGIENACFRRHFLHGLVIKMPVVLRDPAGDFLCFSEYLWLWDLNR